MPDTQREKSMPVRSDACFERRLTVVLRESRSLRCDFCFKQYCRGGCRRSQYASVCLYLSRGTVGVLWSARMKACGGWWASSAGAQAALNPIILVFTPKSQNSWAGSMTLLRQTDVRHRSDQSQGVVAPTPSFFFLKKDTLTY